MSKKGYLLKQARNLMALLIVFVGIINILSAFPYRIKLLYPLTHRYMSVISLHHTLSTILGIALVFMGRMLYKRMRIAWLIVTIAMPVLLVVGSLSGHNHPLLIAELIIFGILIADHRYYDRESDPISLKRGIAAASISALLVVMNTAVGFFMLKEHFRNIDDIFTAIYKSFELLFLMDKSIIQARSRLANVYLDSVITLNWSVTLISLLLILKPLIYQPIVSAMDRAKVRNLVNRFGSNPITYLAVEEDKRYFFSRAVEGVIAYTIANGVAVCDSEPICDVKDAAILTSEFIAYCRENDLSICFCQAPDTYWPELKSLGFGRVKYGDEAMFKLSGYNLAGKRAAKVRYGVNHADRIGIRVEEYRPNEKRDRHGLLRT